MADRADIDVRLVAFKCFLSHLDFPWVKLTLSLLLPAASSGAHDRD
jgi:hypothetical protein